MNFFPGKEFIFTVDFSQSEGVHSLQIDPVCQISCDRNHQNFVSYWNEVCLHLLQKVDPRLRNFKKKLKNVINLLENYFKI